MAFVKYVCLAAAAVEAKDSKPAAAKSGAILGVGPETIAKMKSTAWEMARGSVGVTTATVGCHFAAQGSMAACTAVTQALWESVHTGLKVRKAKNESSKDKKWEYLHQGATTFFLFVVSGALAYAASKQQYDDTNSIYLCKVCAGLRASWIVVGLATGVTEMSKNGVSSVLVSFNFGMLVMAALGAAQVDVVKMLKGAGKSARVSIGKAMKSMKKKK